MFAQSKFIGSYLLTDSKEMLIQNARTLSQIIKQKRKKRGSLEWSFSIPRENPLTFVKSEHDLNLQIDISCEMEGEENNITKQSVLLRVWSYDEKLSFREGVDADELKTRLEGSGWKRVVLRFHIDKRDPKTSTVEPIYHLHVGGLQEDRENCWIPEQLKEPRFPCFPMDLILLCELVLVNFFPKKSDDLRKKPEWKSLIRKSQEIFLKSYVEDCCGYLNNDVDTLLGRLTTP